MGWVRWAPRPAEGGEVRQQRLLHELSIPRGLWTHQSRPGPSFPGHLLAPPWGSHSHTGKLCHLQTCYSTPMAACPSLSPTFAQVTVGGGTPVALHCRLTAAPSVAVTRTGPSSMLGGTGEKEKQLTLHGQGQGQPGEQSCVLGGTEGGTGILPLTVDEQGHVLPVRAQGVAQLAAEAPRVLPGCLCQVQAAVGLDGVTAARGHLGRGREQPRGGTHRPRNAAVSLGHTQKLLHPPSPKAPWHPAPAALALAGWRTHPGAKPTPRGHAGSCPPRTVPAGRGASPAAHPSASVGLAAASRPG